MLIYIVKSGFRNKGKRFIAGDVITNPAEIKNLRFKVSVGQIITLERKSHKTIPIIRFLEHKLGRSILAEVKSYLASVDAINENNEEYDNKEEIEDVDYN